MIKILKDSTLLIAIVLGLLFHHFFTKLNVLTPFLIFIMLYVTLCSIDIHKMKIKKMHVFILGFQLVVSLVFYFVLISFDGILAQGAMVIVLAPTAISAPVIATMLGADLSTMVTSTLISNVAVAVVSPFYFSWIGTHAELSFFQSFWAVIRKVIPLIVFPLIAAVFTQRNLSPVALFLAKQKNLSYYIWAVSLTIVIGRTIDYIFGMERSEMHILMEMALISILVCVIQFSFGRFVGHRFSEVVAGGQSVGQKNTVLAIWMAQTYLNPLSSVIPALYVLWQNVFNSFQLIWNKNRK